LDNGKDQGTRRKDKGKKTKEKRIMEYWNDGMVWEK